MACLHMLKVVKGFKMSGGEFSRHWVDQLALRIRIVRIHLNPSGKPKSAKEGSRCRRVDARRSTALLTIFSQAAGTTMSSKPDPHTVGWGEHTKKRIFPNMFKIFKGGFFGIFSLQIISFFYCSTNQSVSVSILILFVPNFWLLQIKSTIQRELWNGENIFYQKRPHTSPSHTD